MGTVAVRGGTYSGGRARQQQTPMLGIYSLPDGREVLVVPLAGENAALIVERSLPYIVLGERYKPSVLAVELAFRLAALGETELYRKILTGQCSLHGFNDIIVVDCGDRLAAMVLSRDGGVRQPLPHAASPIRRIGGVRFEKDMVKVTVDEGVPGGAAHRAAATLATLMAPPPMRPLPRRDWSSVRAELRTSSHPQYNDEFYVTVEGPVKLKVRAEGGTSLTVGASVEDSEPVSVWLPDIQASPETALKAAILTAILLASRFSQDKNTATKLLAQLLAQARRYTDPTKLADIL